MTTPQAANPMMNAPAMGNPAAADPLSELRPLHLPDPVSWWPPAPGWWILAGIILLVIFFSTIYFIKRRKASAYRRAALQEAEQLFAQYSSDPLSYCQQLNRLLKRVCLTTWPRRETSSLHGTAWLAFLNAQCKKPAFSSNSISLLANSAYKAHLEASAEQIQTLHSDVKSWLQKHKKNLNRQQHSGFAINTQQVIQ